MAEIFGKSSTSSSALDALSPYRMCVYVLAVECASNRSYDRSMLARTFALLIARADMTLAQLICLVKRRLPPNLVAALYDALRSVWRCTQTNLSLLNMSTSSSDDYLMPLLDIDCKAELIFAPGSFVKRNSILGTHLRHVIMSFNILTFAERAQFKQQLHGYVAALGDTTTASLDESGVNDENARPPPPVIDGEEEGDDDEQDDLLLCDQTALTQPHALAFIAKQLHLLRVNESAAMSFASIELMCERIEQKIPAIIQTHYLRMMNALRVGDRQLSQTRLYKYFDRLCFRTLQAQQQARNHDGDLDIMMDAMHGQRFASLIHAKLDRRTRAFSSALTHLQECVQKAEEAGDSACLQFALWEATSLANTVRRLDTAEDTTTHRQLSDKLNNLIESASRSSSEASPDDWQAYRVSWQRELHIADAQLTAVSATLMLSDDVRLDRLEYTMAKYANESSAALQNAQFSSCVTLAQQILLMNSSACKYGVQLATQPISIAYANLAYVASMHGNWSDVQCLLSLARPTREQCDTIDVCDASIGHQRSVLVGQPMRARQQIEVLKERHHTVWQLKEAVVLVVVGELGDALQILHDCAKRCAGNPPLLCQTLLLSCGVHIQLGDMAKAKHYADTVVRYTKDALPHLRAMAECRLAAILMHAGDFDKALLLLDDARSSFDQLALIDRALWHMQRGKVTLRGGGGDVDAAVGHLLTADTMLRRGQAPILQMKNLQLIVGLYVKLGNDAKRNLYAKQWSDLFDKYENCPTIPLDF